MKFLLTLIAAILITHPAQSQTPSSHGPSAQPNHNAALSYKHFERIPILDNGRIKPLGAYARLRLKSFSGKEHLNGQTAAAWLAETLFDPAAAINHKIFHIREDDLKTRLGLDLNQDDFNLTDLQPGLEKTRKSLPTLLQKPDDERTKSQQNLLAIHEKTLTYGQMLRSVSMLLPLDITIPGAYALPKTAPLNFATLHIIEPKITTDLQKIIGKKGQNIDTYTDKERAIALLAFQIQQIRQGSQNGNRTNTELPVFMAQGKNWQSPWQSLNENKKIFENNKEIWLKMAKSFREKHTENWKKYTQTAYKTATTHTSPIRLKTELTYQKTKPYTLAMGLYALSIFLLIITLAKPRLRHIKTIEKTAIIIGHLALLTHAAAITARIYILARPPVGTLYESVLFVSAICAAIALISTWKTKNPLLPLIGQIAAIGLLAIAPIMLQSADSLELLVAVLDTNFWLATHVICITAGYGACIIAATTAHTYMLGRALHMRTEALQKLYRITYKTTLAALLLTAVGTVLGGIWADQSWGRFWGWDPKENGALLIVLWLIWTLHARLSGHMKDLTFIASIAFVNIIVALAWFGVNLLGIGLHSYGFTSGLATGLATFCIIETIVIAVLFMAVRTKERALKT